MADSLAGSIQIQPLPTTMSRILIFVTVEEPPISFSPLTLADCMALSHFSFNDFIAIDFLDLGKDLEIPIYSDSQNCPNVLHFLIVY